MAFADFLPGALKRAKGKSSPIESRDDNKIIADPKSTPEEKKAAIERAKQRLKDRMK